MYTKLADKLAIPASTALYLQPISMSSANAAQVEYTVFSISGGTLTVSIEEGNDCENWGTLLSGAASTTSLGVEHKQFRGTAIAGQWVRVKCSMSAGGSAVVAAGINTALL